jgi:LmbE family N-acetylglucosaminyl deacetylase
MSDAFLAAQRVLVLTPHPDDETMGCAGTIARVKAAGGEVYCLVATMGGIDQYCHNVYPSDQQEPSARMRFVSGAERLGEFRAVMELLKVDAWDTIYGDDVHMALDTIARHDAVARIERVGPLSLEALRPTMVLMPAPSFNQDHEALFRACLAATRPTAPGRRHTVSAVLMYDNGTAHWARASEPFHPNLYVDISDYTELKLKALDLYTSQWHGAPAGGDQSISSLMYLYGAHVGVRAAEAFQALRMVL